MRLHGPIVPRAYKRHDPEGTRESISIIKPGGVTPKTGAVRHPSAGRKTCTFLTAVVFWIQGFPSTQKGV